MSNLFVQCETAKAAPKIVPPGTVATIGDIHKAPGIMRCIDGKLYDLVNMKPEDITIENIAWGLGRTLRYGGHIVQDYTVAHHCIVMSYCVGANFALEALLHDAAEAFIGDIINPVKSLFPDIAMFENQILAKIMQRFNVKTAQYENKDGKELYVMSNMIRRMDHSLYLHECYDLGRPGVFDPFIESSWLKAAEEHGSYWYAGQYAFLERFDQLCGTAHCDLDALTKLWFPEETTRPTTEERAVHALDEVLGLAKKEGDK